MLPRKHTPKRRFARDFGIAALIAIPLAGAAAGVWLYTRTAEPGAAPSPFTIALLPLPSSAPATLGETTEAPRAEPVVPYFEIRRSTLAAIAAPPPAAVSAPAPAPPPRVSDAGWEARAVRPPQVRAGAWIAIVIDDLGLDRARTARAAALPGPLTLSYMSYAADVGEQARQGREAGHEIMLHMPMEPEGREDPGPGALTVRLPEADIRARTAAALDRLPLAVGLNNHMGSRFTRDAAAMRPVLQELAARGLLFVDSRTSGASVAGDLAASMGLAHAVRDVFLDNEIEATYVRRQLAELERVANRRGQAVAIGHPHDATVEALAAWLPTLNSRGLQLVPVSALARQQRLVAATAGPAAVAAAPQIQRALDLPPAAGRNVQVRAQAPASEPAASYAGEPPWKRYPIE